MSQNFFSKINYSACNEDSFSEIKSLKINENDIVLCITASGARSLDLLVESPKKIISFDLNKSQNHLLSLKIASYKALNYKEFLSFLGIENNFSRKNLFQKVEKFLDEENAIFWKNNMHLIESGVIYSGTWEKILKNMAKLAFFRKKKLQKLFSFDDIEKQKEFWDKHWNNAIWKIFIKLITNNFLWKYIIKEPGFLLIPKDFSVENFIHQRLDFLLSNFLLKENHFANLIFLGKYEKDCILPIHLQEKNFEKIQKNLDKIEIITDSLQNIIQNKNIFQNITACSLSDFGSYCSDEEYKKIWLEIVENANNGLKICERQFVLKRNTSEISEKIICDFVLQKELENTDSSVFYSFISANIKK